MTEEWRPVPGWPDYHVSNLGRVMSYKNPRRPRLKIETVSRQGYSVVFLHRDSVQHSFRVHRLVGEAFLGPRPAGLETRHLDGDPTNNRLDNLAYGTHLENEEDKARHGTHHLLAKTHCPKGHPYDGANLVRDSHSGARRCRICRNEQILRARRRYQARLRAEAQEAV